MIWFIVLATLSLFAAAVTGWLLALRASATANAATLTALAAAEQRATDAAAQVVELSQRAELHEAELSSVRETTASVNSQLQEAQVKLGVSERAAANASASAHRAQRAMAEAVASQAAQRAEIASLRERLSADRESGREREGRAVAEVQRVLAPLIERERLGAELARLEIGRGTRRELPRIVDAIARIGDFSSVVLSDEGGLPLAVFGSSAEGELLAGLWSMLLVIADRVTNAGSPAPIAIVVHDAANQTIVHRLFSSAGSRFLLSAVSHGRALPPEVLDPALGKLERVLANTPLAAS